jgi:phosphoribosylformimino-5-aminoimidazole carboxamide ribotide isomerase
LEDIIALRELRAYGIEGVIIGQALYQGRFSLTEAIKAAGEQKE